MDNKTKATVSLVLGIVSASLAFISIFVMGWLSFIALPAGIVAIVFGVKGKQENGKGLAGFILGIVGTALAGLAVILYTIALITLAAVVA